MKVDELAREAASLESAAFADRYPSPALVAHRARSLEESRLDTPESGIRLLGSTRRVKKPGARHEPTPSRGARLGISSKEYLGHADVIFLAKTDRNPYQNMITLGRAPNNDVSVAETSVSKLHASFTPGNGGWKITDQGSTNGTFVDEKQLSSGASAELEDGARIALGPELHVRFFTPKGLFAFLALFRAGDAE